MKYGDEDFPVYHRLEWIDGRWHCEHQPINAGDAMEILADDGLWMPIRIESSHGGALLLVYFAAPGLGDRSAHVNLYDTDQLRWPRKRRGPVDEPLQINNLPTPLLEACEHAFGGDSRIVSVTVETHMGRLAVTSEEIREQLGGRPTSLFRR